ncbi:M20/M25/M40 family metallo-hydrolase [Anoxynatronum buryatiense]|uniref:Arginine utilization protein RocB n=1 Tax=Anoxynatronum buryatiense TaxID=489973 RepID=A0AA46AIG9_9CLOT|nr:M20/M25/M40 family metallo-hydrolase [Anoxynatronum buryatiense]SMP49093.1 Arginine utilization protein RocB [Anoxynatronum buryatiense]
MLEINRERLEALFYNLVATPGISGTTQENTTSETIMAHFESVPYFQKHTQYLRAFPIEGDAFHRKVVTALVKGKSASNRTIVMIGHTDVVDASDYGKNQDVAFHPQELMKRINPESLSPDARRDYESGEWIFGRGVMDMRCGVAVAMAMIEAAADNLDTLEGNLLFVGVPDEENNSLGMISATNNLVTLAETHDLDYMVCIDGEPQFPRYPGDPGKYVYQGTLGKFVLMAYAVGKETHGGDSLTGLNANLIISELTRRIELNMDLADIFEDVVVSPPTSLKQTDTKEHYNVKTPESAYAYYNFLTADQSPKHFFDQVRQLAMEAMQDALQRQKDQTRRYFQMTGSTGSYYDWSPTVLSYSELWQMAVENGGQTFEAHMDSCRKKWKQQPEMDQRILSLEMVQEVHSFCADQHPKIILLYVPPYYPHIKPSTTTPRQAKAAQVVNQVADYAKEVFGETVLVDKFFTGLCDLSFVCLQNAEDVISNIQPNMPNWGFSYELPVETIKKLNLPVMNIGPYGKDAHKNTERLHTDYSFRVYPALLSYAIQELLQPESL